MSAAGLRIVAEAIRAVRERDEARRHAEALSTEIEVWRALAEDSGRAEETLCAEVDRLRAELAEERKVSDFARGVIEHERACRIREFARAEDLVDQVVAGRLTAAHLRTKLAEARDAIESTAECWRTRAEEAERENARLRAFLDGRPGRAHMDWEERS